MIIYITLFSFVILFSMAIPSYAKVVITDNGSPESAHASAVFELQSTTKGMLVPKMTTAQRNAISPAASGAGLLVFDTDKNKFYVFNGSIWVTSEINWLGSTTRIKLLPKDFVGTITGGGKGSTTALSVYIDSTDNNDDSYGMSTTEDNAYLVAFAAIPSGYKATEVLVYGNNTGDVYAIYEGNIATTDDLTTPITNGSGKVGTLLNFTDVTSTTTNYLIVVVKFTNKEKDVLYGGYITITPD